MPDLSSVAREAAEPRAKLEARIRELEGEQPAGGEEA